MYVHRLQINATESTYIIMCVLTSKVRFVQKISKTGFQKSSEPYHIVVDVSWISFLFTLRLKTDLQSFMSNPTVYNTRGNENIIIVLNKRGLENN